MLCIMYLSEPSEPTMNQVKRATSQNEAVSPESEIFNPIEIERFFKVTAI